MPPRRGKVPKSGKITAQMYKNGELGREICGKSIPNFVSLCLRKFTSFCFFLFTLERPSLIKENEDDS